MASEVNVTLQGQTHSGQVSDVDGLFFAGLLLPEYERIIKTETGLREAFEEFSRANGLLVEQSDKPEQQADEMYNAWGERFLIRITNNLNIRDAVAQRLTEIFPTVPSQLLSYRRWSDNQGNNHSDSRIRLNTTEVMDFVTAIVSVMELPATSSKRNPPTVPTKLKAKSGDRKERIAQLQAELAAAQGEE